MHCGKCKFQVTQDMKFALMKNICPACGLQLFSDSEMKDINMLVSRLGKQSFSLEFTKELVFDISLFILDEIKNGIGQKYFQAMTTKSNPPISSEDGAELDDSEEDIRQRMREEIEDEFPALKAMPDEEVTVRTRDESANEKAKRLRDVARKSGLGNKQGTMVRRAGS